MVCIMHVQRQYCQNQVAHCLVILHKKREQYYLQTTPARMTIIYRFATRYEDQVMNAVPPVVKLSRGARR